MQVKERFPASETNLLKNFNKICSYFGQVLPVVVHKLSSKQKPL